MLIYQLYESYNLASTLFLWLISQFWTPVDKETLVFFKTLNWYIYLPSLCTINRNLYNTEFSYILFYLLGNYSRNSVSIIMQAYLFLFIDTWYFIMYFFLPNGIHSFIANIVVFCHLITILLQLLWIIVVLFGHNYVSTSKKFHVFSQSHTLTETITGMWKYRFNVLNYKWM